MPGWKGQDMSNEVKQQGDTVTIKAKSSATAREIAAAARTDLLKKEGGVAGHIHVAGEWVSDVSRALGKGTFEIIASALLVVGGVIEFLSWSRLLPLEHVGANPNDPTGTDLRWLIGLVGLAIMLGVKVCAARVALRQNEKDDALAAGKPELAKMKAEKASVYTMIVIVGALVNAVAALAFGAAISVDAQSGRIDYDEQIAGIERKARQLEYEAEALPRPADDLALLREDLDRFLKSTAYNNAGQATPLSRAAVIGWGVDEDGKPLAEPGEAYCLPGGEYQSYVDRYCPDAADLHRKVKQKQSWADRVSAAQTMMAEAQQLRDTRPVAASAVALGGAAGIFGSFWKFVPPMALMALILLVMVFASYVAKRDLEGASE